MSLSVRTASTAEDHIGVAYHWYEGQRAGLGSEFLDEFDVFCHRISQHPGLCPIHRHSIRRGVLHRFPYIVFYVIEPAALIVIAVLHAHRDPADWP